MSTDLKKVNSDWQKARFDEIATVVTDRIDKPIESGLKDYIGLEHLDTDCIRIKRFGSTEDVDATKFLCKKGDIIFGKRNSYLRKVAISDRDAVVSAHSMVLRPTGDKIYPNFLPCFMQSSIFWKTAHSISEGSMSPTIKWKTLAAQEFWLPSIEEQKKISELLWSIEDNIQKTEELIETTEKLKQGLLNELLTKGIGHTRFKDSELGRIPEEWEVKKISDITEYVSYGFTNPMPTTDEGPFMITAANINKGKIQYDSARHTLYTAYEELTPKSKPIIDDILLTKDGTLGKVAIVDRNDICINQSVACMRLKKESINLNFFVQMLQSPYIQKRMLSDSSGSTIKHIYITKFAKMVVPIPSKEEQQSIVQILEKVETELEKQNVHIEKLSRLKNKLTNELLSEKLEVPLSSSKTLIKALS